MKNDYPELASGEVAEIYFRGVKNLAERRIQDIFKLLGEPLDYDDWDLGRLVYDWRSAERCVRVFTKNDWVTAVHLMDPVNTPRCGEALEVLWCRPEEQ